MLTAQIIGIIVLVIAIGVATLAKLLPRRRAK